MIKGDLVAVTDAEGAFMSVRRIVIRSREIVETSDGRKWTTDGELLTEDGEIDPSRKIHFLG
jgi:hypothetical protein